MPEAHARYSASASKRWLTCPGSVWLSEKFGVKRPDTVYSAEGTAAHTLAERCLNTGRDADSYIGDELEVGEFTFEVDDDFAESVQVYVDLVREYTDGADYAGFEQRVYYHDDIGCDEGDGFGTSDSVIIKNRTLYVVDLKFGRGDKVAADDNTQLALYALGALNLLQADPVLGSTVEVDRVCMVISQPRVAKAPREWEISVDELRKLCADVLRPGVERCIDARLEWSDSPEWWAKFTQASEDGCKYCSFRMAEGGCPTSRNSVTSAVHNGTAATPDEFADLDVVLPAALTDEAWLDKAMAKVEEIEDWCIAVRTEVEARLLNGITVGEWKLVEGKRPPRKWTDKDDAEKQLESFRLKHEQRYTYKLISPTQAEKLAKVSAKDAKAGVKPAIGERQWKKLAELIDSGKPKAHVAPGSDPRPALEIKPVAEEFDVITDDPNDVSDLV